jgi:peptidoglycan/LPS O-acetylase OafA/YrhL
MNAGESQAPRTAREAPLDGLRGVAILWVMAYHYLALPARAAHLALPSVVASVAGSGWMGVDLFFVLSGYLITRGLVGQPRDGRFFWSFAVKRVFRIAPAYYLLLGLTLILPSLWPAAAEPDRIFAPGIPMGSYAVFLQNLAMIRVGSLGNDWLRVLWSLAVEVQFYVVAALVVFVVPRRFLVGALGLMVVLAVGMRYFTYFNVTDPSLAFVVLLPNRMDAFALGGLIALHPARRIGAAHTVGALAVIAAAAGFLHYYTAGAFGARTVYIVPLYYSAISLGCAAAVEVCAHPWGPIQRIMSLSALTLSGELSYFMYLFHMPVVLCAFAFGMHRLPALGTSTQAAVMLGSALGVFILARLSFTYLEAPLIRMSHRIARMSWAEPSI